MEKDGDENKLIENSVVKDSWGNEIEVDKTKMLGEKAKKKGEPPDV